MEALSERTVRRPYQPPELVKRQPLPVVVAQVLSPGGDDDISDDTGDDTGV